MPNTYNISVTLQFDKERIMNKKLIIIVSVACVCILAVLGVIFWGSNGTSAQQSSGEKSYTITVLNTQNGSVNSDKESAKAGETINLTVQAEKGYQVECLKVNGENITFSGETASFIMPESNVEVDCVFVKSTQITESVPGVTLFVIEAVSVRESAVGNWSVKFGETALEISVWVEDSYLYPNEDGIKVYFGKKGYDRKLGENNFGVQVLLNGTVKTFKVENSSYVQGEILGVSASVWEWIKPGASEKCGFKVKLNVAYSAFNVGKDSAKGSITMLASQTNKNYDTNAARESVMTGRDVSNPTTYPVITNDNACEENPMNGATAQLGKTSIAKAGAYWDCSKDYFPDEDEYENRKVTLTGHDSADNNIYFFNTAGGSQMYAEATFKVTDLHNPNEKYGKFGLMFFDGSAQNGLFFYVDAYIGSDILSVNNISGTELGYNQATGGWGSWNTIPDTQNAFDLATKTVTLKMAFKNNLIYLYLGDELILTKSQTASKYATIGIKSFGYGLEVTNYYATKDASDPKLIAHTPNDSAKQVGVMFIGDDYMDGWTEYKTADITVSKVKESISGSVVSDWEAKLTSLKSMYKPAKVVLSVGYNDIKNGETPQTVFEKLKTLISEYQESLENAKLYWVSIIPTPNDENNQKYEQLNALVSAYAQTQNNFEFIDVASKFKANGEIRRNMYYESNGVCGMNVEFGYPLWGTTIVNALGYTRTEGEALGDNQEGYAYSNGWIFEQNGAVAVNVGINEQAIWSNKMQYSADLYFEAEVYVPENTGADSFPKAGLVIRNDKFTIFAYADFTLISGSDCMYNIVYRPNGEHASGSWLWDNQGNGGYGKNIANSYVKLAIAKLGNTIYLLCENNVVATYEIPVVNAQDEFIAGVLNFNRKTYVKNAVAITDKTEVSNKLNVQIIPEANLNGASILGGASSEHETQNLTYDITVYEKTYNLQKQVDFAWLYITKTGGYVVCSNSTQLQNEVTTQKQGDTTVFVYDIKNTLQEGNNTLKITTADKNTKICAKLVVGFTDTTSFEVVTDNSWQETLGQKTIEQKPNLYFLGSSVTYGSANNGVSFVEKIQDELGYLCVKEAVSGTTLVDNGSNSYIQRMKNNILSSNRVDHLIVQLSTNDVTQNKPFGRISDSKDLSSFDTSTVLGAIEYIIAYAKQTWGAEVSFYTNPDFNNVTYKALISELYKVKNKWNIGVLDFYNYVDMPILETNVLNGYMSDAIHPNDSGYTWMSKIFSEYLQNSLEKNIIKQYLA